MSGYTPQVGDRVQSRITGIQFDVRAVGRHKFFAVRVGGEPSLAHDEMALSIQGYDWEKVETPEPIPEMWINAYATGLGSYRDSRTEADAMSNAKRLAVVRVWTDEHGTDHAEIERVES